MKSKIQKVLTNLTQKVTNVKRSALKLAAKYVNEIRRYVMKKKLDWRRKHPVTSYKIAKRLFSQFKTERKEFRKAKEHFKRLYSELSKLGVYPGMYHTSIFEHNIEGLDAVQVCEKITKIMIELGFEFSVKWFYNQGSYDATFMHGEYRHSVWVWGANDCEIEDYEEVVTKKRVTGLCAKAIESLNELN